MAFDVMKEIERCKMKKTFKRIKKILNYMESEVDQSAVTLAIFAREMGDDFTSEQLNENKVKFLEKIYDNYFDCNIMSSFLDEGLLEELSNYPKTKSKQTISNKLIYKVEHEYIYKVEHEYIKEKLDLWLNDSNIETYSLFYAKDIDGRYVAVDNRSNEFFVEDFHTEAEAVVYLMGYEIENHKENIDKVNMDLVKDLTCKSKDAVDEGLVV